MRITCPACKSSEGFTVVRNIFVTTEIDANGEQIGGTDYGNDGQHRWLNCAACGHSWRTRRHFNLDVDVR